VARRRSWEIEAGSGKREDGRWRGERREPEAARPQSERAKKSHRGAETRRGKMVKG